MVCLRLLRCVRVEWHPPRVVVVTAVLDLKLLTICGLTQESCVMAGAPFRQDDILSMVRCMVCPCEVVALVPLLARLSILVVTMAVR